jgi:hypothetical protein
MDKIIGTSNCFFRPEDPTYWLWQIKMCAEQIQLVLGKYQDPVPENKKDFFNTGIRIWKHTEPAKTDEKTLYIMVKNKEN